VKAAGIVIALAIAGALLYWFVLRGHAETTPAQTARTAKAGSATTTPSAPPTKPKPVDRVRRITKEERAALAQQIEAARTEHAHQVDHAEGQMRQKPSLEAQADDVTIVKTTMKAAMQEVIPMLSDCYDKGGSNLPPALDVVAKLTLTGDPDVGTIVDANSLENKDGTPVDAAFGACVQDTLVTLEMPPISEGDVVQVTYPFAFARDDSTMPP
jgi:hypothetical protein